MAAKILTQSRVALPPNLSRVNAAALTACFPVSTPSNHTTVHAASGMRRVTLGRSRMRESRTPGSVMERAEWMS